MVDCNYPSMSRLTTDADNALHRRDYQTATTLYLIALERPSIQPYLRAVILTNLGLAWQYLNEIEKATACFEDAVAANPKLASAQTGLGLMYARRARHAEALERYDQALRLDATCAITHSNRALTLEALGRIEEAWKESEWRYSIPTATSLYPYRYTKPKWKGERLQGRTLLVHREQGLGDVIQYLRFLRPLSRLDGRVRFECPPPLLPLVSSMPGLEAIPAQSHPVPEEMFDCYVPLLSLPHLLNFSAAELPTTCPYLPATPSDENNFATRWGNGLKIGFVWSGSTFDWTRNAALADFLPLVSLNARLVSLQKDVSESEQRQLSEYCIESAGTAFRHFGDTRDAILALDAVVTVDTAVAHLAGALAKPTWLLLNEPAAVRWMMNRADSPWYPTMRIRHKGDGEHWQAMIVSVASEIEREL
ncbi:MAG: tetratricopeptide repeat-containing glycosyltransferase family protein [Pseudomonadota bacterium]|nr:tetratricopeptide repeat-containing glycosyltransferase family protein [Pseudomonadota bacterium]